MQAGHGPIGNVCPISHQNEPKPPRRYARDAEHVSLGNPLDPAEAPRGREARCFRLFRVDDAMFSTRKRRIRPAARAPEPTEQVLALIERVRVMSATDEALAELLVELEPHLPKALVVETRVPDELIEL